MLNLKKIISKTVNKQTISFAIAGLISTGIMFGIYVILYKHIYFQYAYFIAYCISVIALYFMNSAVFKKEISLQTSLEFPLIYLLQYVLSAASLEFFVWLGVSETYAPLLIILILLPLTFLLNRIVFRIH
ncbi:MAG: GtrA family protein [Tatlockia sp.]|nr:GtrA family protein [Tatlockia sp.]